MSLLSFAVSAFVGSTGISQRGFGAIIVAPQAMSGLIDRR